MKTDTIRIRPLLPEDWPRVKEIYRQGIEEGNSTFEQEPPSWEYWDTAHLAQCRLVAVQGEEVVGFVAFSPTSKRAAYRGIVEVSLYVARESRGMGVGSALLDAGIEATESDGYYCLYASTFQENHSSLALQKSRGFRVIGTRERIAKDRFGNWRTTVLTERRSSKVGL